MIYIAGTPSGILSLDLYLFCSLLSVVSLVILIFYSCHSFDSFHGISQLIIQFVLSRRLWNDGGKFTEHYEVLQKKTVQRTISWKTNNQGEKKRGRGAIIWHIVLNVTSVWPYPSSCADAASFNCAGCFTWATQTHEKTVVLIELYGTTAQSVRLMPEKKSGGMWISSRAPAPWDECRADRSSKCTRHLYTQCCALTQFMHIVYCQGHSILVWRHMIPSYRSYVITLLNDSIDWTILFFAALETSDFISIFQLKWSMSK